MRARKTYHHGHLQQALLDAAIQLIGEVGHNGFTLREVARRAGVSHNAPYRHFADRDELLSAVAAQGFRELNEAMLEAGTGEPTPLGRLKQAGAAYVEFALRRPEHFTVMFDASIAKSESDAQAFETLLGLIKECQEAGSLPGGEPLRLALLAWSMVHGVAKLATAQRLPYKTKGEILRFAKFVIEESLPGTGR